MAPAGRPRKPENRDLAPGVYRRTRKGKMRYYDGAGRALGTDRERAALAADAEGISAQKLLGHKSARTTESYLRDKRVPVVKGPRQA